MKRSCDHHICGKEEQVWLPATDHRYGSVEKHPWCTCCGTIKNISDDRPKHIGFWMNMLSFIGDQYHLTQVQKRLIAKELEASEVFSDTFGSFGSDQKHLFVQMVEKHVPLDTRFIDSLQVI